MEKIKTQKFRLKTFDQTWYNNSAIFWMDLAFVKATTNQTDSYSTRWYKNKQKVKRLICLC